jgi:hypothetical protein
MKSRAQRCKGWSRIGYGDVFEYAQQPGRCSLAMLMSHIFIISGWSKLTGYSGTQGYFASSVFPACWRLWLLWQLLAATRYGEPLTIDVQCCISLQAAQCPIQGFMGQAQFSRPGLA